MGLVVPNSAAGAKIPAEKHGRSIGKSSPGGVALLPELHRSRAAAKSGRRDRSVYLGEEDWSATHSNPVVPAVASG